jgi:hypothetical protein
MRTRDKERNLLDAEVRRLAKKAKTDPGAQIQTSIRVDKEVWRWARILALEEGRTVSELISEALYRYWKHRAYQARYKEQARKEGK